MERADLVMALALARRIILYGPHDHGHNWVDADNQGANEVAENPEEGGREDELAWSAAPFDLVIDGNFIELAEDWNIDVAPGATQNKLSYCVDFFLDKISNKVSNEFIRKRLRRETVVFGVDLPQDVRGIARMIGSRKIQEVVRHKCLNCDFAWLGSVSVADYDLNEMCPDCGSPRYHDTSAGVKPVSQFWYFGVDSAISRMHKSTSFQSAYKKNIDQTINSYRKSPDGRRLDAATGGEAFSKDNALYVCYVDGFRPHENSVQGLTGCRFN
jgi:hypothetical protein